LILDPAEPAPHAALRSRIVDVMIRAVQGDVTLDALETA
jgi:hypothetical protein